MRRAMTGVMLLLVGGLSVGGWAMAAGGRQPVTTEAAQSRIEYHPPKRGKPGVRIGGGSRGEGGQTVALAAIVPDHVALSATATPALCWHQSEPTTHTRVLVLDDGQGVKPVLEQDVDQPNRVGIQCVGLERFGVTLKAEIEYDWFIVAMIDPTQRSKDVVSGGAVMFKAPAPELAEKIKGSPGHDLPPLWAAGGYWYDAVASVITGLTEQAADPKYLAMKDALLRQGDLPAY